MQFGTGLQIKVLAPILLLLETKRDEEPQVQSLITFLTRLENARKPFTQDIKDTLETLERGSAPITPGWLRDYEMGIGSPTIDFSFATKSGQTLLMIAAKNGHHNFVRVLLNFKASPMFADLNGDTALTLAANSSNPSSIDLLLEAGAAAVNHKNKKEKTALMYAAANGYAKQVEALLDAKADVNLSDFEYKKTALHYAIEESKLDGHDLELMLPEIENGQQQPEKGKVYVKIVNGAIKYIVSGMKECSQISQNEFGSTPIPTSFESLQDHKQKILEIASKKVPQLDCMKALIAKNAALDHIDYIGSTPFFTAAKKANVQAIRMLLEGNPKLVDQSDTRSYSLNALSWLISDANITGWVPNTYDSDIFYLQHEKWKDKDARFLITAILLSYGLQVILPDHFLVKFEEIFSEQQKRHPSAAMFCKAVVFDQKGAPQPDLLRKAAETKPVFPTVLSVLGAMAEEKDPPAAIRHHCQAIKLCNHRGVDGLDRIFKRYQADLEAAPHSQDVLTNIIRLAYAVHELLYLPQASLDNPDYPIESEDFTEKKQKQLKSLFNEILPFLAKIKREMNLNLDPKEWEFIAEQYRIHNREFFPNNPLACASAAKWAVQQAYNRTPLQAKELLPQEFMLVQKCIALLKPETSAASDQGDQKATGDQKNVSSVESLDDSEVSTPVVTEVSNTPVVLEAKRGFKEQLPELLSLISADQRAWFLQICLDSLPAPTVAPVSAVSVAASSSVASPRPPAKTANSVESFLKNLFTPTPSPVKASANTGKSPSPKPVLIPPPPAPPINQGSKFSGKKLDDIKKEEDRISALEHILTTDLKSKRDELIQKLSKKMFSDFLENFIKALDDNTKKYFMDTVLAEKVVREEWASNIAKIDLESETPVSTQNVQEAKTWEVLKSYRKMPANYDEIPAQDRDMVLGWILSNMKSEQIDKLPWMETWLRLPATAREVYKNSVLKTYQDFVVNVETRPVEETRDEKSETALLRVYSSPINLLLTVPLGDNFQNANVKVDFALHTKKEFPQTQWNNPAQPTPTLTV